MHYQRWKAHGDALKKIKRVKFAASIPHGTGHGYSYYKCRCDECAGWNRSYGSAWREANPKKMQAYSRDSALRKTYGITLAEFDKMLAAQGGGCAICDVTENTPPYHKSLHVDHDHDTGEIRGILCAKCNHGIAKFDDDPDRLRSAADYLMRTSASDDESRAASWMNL